MRTLIIGKAVLSRPGPFSPPGEAARPEPDSSGSDRGAAPFWLDVSESLRDLFDRAVGHLRGRRRLHGARDRVHDRNLSDSCTYLRRPVRSRIRPKNAEAGRGIRRTVDVSSSVRLHREIRRARYTQAWHAAV